MVRKTIAIFFCVLVLCAAVCGTTQAAEKPDSWQEYNLYFPEYGFEIPTKVLNDFKGIVSKLKFNEDYVVFCQNDGEYYLVAGNIEFNIDGKFPEISPAYFYSNEPVKVCGVVFTPDTNEYLFVPFQEAENVLISYDNFTIVYSNLGDFPELVTRGEKFEILNTFILCFALLCVFVHRIFHWR